MRVTPCLGFLGGGMLMWAPLFASLFDVFEDLGLHQMVSDFAAGDALSTNLAVVTTLFAVSKYFLLAGVAPAWGVWGSVLAFKTDRRPRSIGLYVFVILVAASMVQKPLQEIPACF